MRFHCLYLAVLFFALGCKKKTLTELSTQSDTAESPFNSGMFVPFSNVGYDPAFCAGSSAIHALIANRARFYPAKVPSQKCPRLWNAKDDAKYDERVWKIIEQEVLKQDFVSQETIKIYGAFNFYQYGTRNLQLFAPVIRRIQSVLGQPDNWRNIGSTKLVDFNRIAEITRQNNFLIVAVHSTEDNPDSNYKSSYENLKKDCESRGYRWDSNTNRCDWSKKIEAEPLHPSPSPYPNGNPLYTITDKQISSELPYPLQPMPRELGPELETPNIPSVYDPNHAVLVTGSYDDRTVEVYTTWSQELKRWRADLSVQYGDKSTWMVNPHIVETIPNKINENRDTAPDLLADLNLYYGYAGPNAGPGCPGDKIPQGSNTPVSGTYEYFNFTVNIETKGTQRFLIIEDVKGCPAGQISWSITKTAFNPTQRGSISNDQTIVHGRWSTNANTRRTSWPLAPDINRAVVTGACGEQTYSVPILGEPVERGNK